LNGGLLITPGVWSRQFDALLAPGAWSWLPFWLGVAATLLVSAAALAVLNVVLRRRMAAKADELAGQMLGTALSGSPVVAADLAGIVRQALEHGPIGADMPGPGGCPLVPGPGPLEGLKP
jgi:hypothetical protein